MTRASELLNRYVVPPLTAISENTYMSAIRAGMVAVVPLTIIGGLFMVVAEFPVEAWTKLIAPWHQLMEYPFKATFGLLAVFVSFAIAYDLGHRLRQDPLSSASIATLVFLLLQLKLSGGEEPAIELNMDGLGSGGLFTAVVVSLVSVRVQKWFADRNLVIKLPPSVPAVVYESFVSLVPMFALVVVFWGIRFGLGVDVNAAIQTAFQPLVFALNTLPGILVYGFCVTMLWSVGINGDNAMDALVAPVFLAALAANAEAVSAGLPPPNITALGFFTTFVNVGGTGATLGLALIMLNSKEPGYRKVSRLSLPTQVFQINEPIFFGFPIVLNPLLMMPYILSALLLTAGTYLLMDWGWIQKPWVNVPWTTPPIIGHYLVTGGDWRAAVWGVVSIGLAMLVYFPFARVAERQRLNAEAGGRAES
ncbi:MAG: PTS sugar transporter subunit IIC [Verrucomicrobia bacterium]|nr:PTS sugar transporter subunit IIC [Verrucomicrobiota bacterium]